MESFGTIIPVILLMSIFLKVTPIFSEHMHLTLVGWFSIIISCIIIGVVWLFFFLFYWILGCPEAYSIINVNCVMLISFGITLVLTIIFLFIEACWKHKSIYNKWVLRISFNLTIIRKEGFNKALFLSFIGTDAIRLRHPNNMFYIGKPRQEYKFGHTSVNMDIYAVGTYNNGKWEIDTEYTTPEPLLIKYNDIIETKLISTP